MHKYDFLNAVSRKIRLRILDLTYRTGKKGAHVGGGLSVVEILVLLYLKKLKFNVQVPLDESRDRFILSKGHSAIALFSILEEVGFINSEELNSFETNGSSFYAHASRNLLKGIEFSGGSLSLGLSYAVGVALSCKSKGLNNHIYVLIGDGECNEGLIWESLMSASHFNLTNLTVIVDSNGLQSDGYTTDVMSNDLLAEKFEAFGFSVNKVDGHDFVSLNSAIESKDLLKPNAIIARTVKGKGVSFMENDAKWHHGSLSSEQYELALLEQSKQ